jgi:hypothetical protein
MLNRRCRPLSVQHSAFRIQHLKTEYRCNHGGTEDTEARSTETVYQEDAKETEEVGVKKRVILERSEGPVAQEAFFGNSSFASLRMTDWLRFALLLLFLRGFVPSW